MAFEINETLSTTRFRNLTRRQNRSQQMADRPLEECEIEVDLKTLYRYMKSLEVRVKLDLSRYRGT